LEIIAALIFLMLGASVGSFLNVVADRVPQGKSIVSPPSHCFGCGRELQARDLVPVISYIVLKGKCRYCGAEIPIRSMLLELITGLLFMLAYIRFGITWQLAAAVIYCSIFVLLAIVDMERRSIPLIIILPCIAAALIIDLVNTWFSFSPDIFSALAGAAVGLALFLLAWGVPLLFKKHMIDRTDILLAGLAGLAVGFPLTGAAILLAALAGGLAAIALRLIKGKKITELVAFAPYMAFGALAVIFFNDALLYLLKAIFS